VGRTNRWAVSRNENSHSLYCSTSIVGTKHCWRMKRPEQVANTAKRANMLPSCGI
jgi:hypothetical protein